MNNLNPFFIRLSAFVGKEIFAILGQPMLVLTLVLGPFLILLLFGLGFRNEPRALRTLFVIDSSNNLSREIESYATTLGPELIYMGVTSDPAEARQKLLEREVDLVAEIPSNAYETILNSKQAIFKLKHYEIDPLQVDYVKIFGRVYVNEINRRILRTATTQGQRQSASIDNSLADTKESVGTLRQALEGNVEPATRQHRRKLERDADNLAVAVGTTVGMVKDIRNTLGTGNSPDQTDTILERLSDVQDGVNDLNEPENEGMDIKNIDKLEQDLVELETLLAEFQAVDSNVLVSPFRSEASNITAIRLRPSDFFAPAVIVLLLQHLAITFGALSIVKERQSGTIELFRVSPISAFETIVGKYLSYFLFATGLTIILTLILVFGLGVPMLGNLLYFSFSLAALLFASLGFGFVISLLATTDSAAVQYSMILLLTSVFFSGAFVGLRDLWEPVQVVSWMLPATYGIVLLQNIMLRGFLDAPQLLLSLIGIGCALFLIAWFLLHKQMARD